jgi:uncharacterized membrane protein
MRAAWLLIHLLAAMVWIGGMVFAVRCLRPAVAGLAPPDRLALMARVLQRFFDLVTIAVVGLWASGFGLLADTPFELVPITWWVMSLIAVVMTGIFIVLRLKLLPRLLKARDSGDAPAAAATLARMHPLVVTNLVLGLVAIAQLKLF